MNQLQDTQNFLLNLLEKIFGLETIYITDNQGVVLDQISKTQNIQKKEFIFGPLFANLSNQTSKLGFGENQSITTFYKEKIMVQIQLNSIILSLIGDLDLNVGLIDSYIPTFTQAFQHLIETVGEIEKNKKEINL
ncbi:regulator complex protein lamtor3 [Anaeramoeba ignava]|uniref:Regulator complex protein lamtor3 n=1 Tax=Anaeramoeba ignava TaxID=1746090 RepID=A0A9Q0L8S4_ANAIG|nr:regulator complex protein lamtor3 [Anaeramoeba ignava]